MFTVMGRWRMVLACDRMLWQGLGVLNLMLVPLQTTALLLGAFLMILMVWSLAERADGFSFGGPVLLVVPLEDVAQSSCQDASWNGHSIRRNRRGSPLALSNPHAEFQRAKFDNLW